MLRKEAVQLPGPDPAGLRKLATFRAQLQAKDADISAAAQRQREFAQTRASLAREHKFAELTQRMHKADDDKRASDRAFPVRPLTHLDSDLWEFQNIRQWFSGGDATLSNSLRDPAEAAANAPSGPALVASGYLRPVDRAELAFQRSAREDRAKEVTANIAAQVSDSGTNARATARRHWQRSDAKGAHWLDRSAVLEQERALARDVLQATGFHGDLVNRGRPYKTDFPVRTGAGNGSMSWREPSQAELLQTERSRFERSQADFAESRAGAAARKAALTGSRPRDYFGGE